MTGHAAIRLGIVGCGRLTEAGYLPALSLTDRFALTAVADPDAARRRTVADRCSGPDGPAAFPNAAALLASGEADAVVLATPAAAHLADASGATDAGIPVLVEKPPADDAGGARRLADLRPAPWIGFNRRFDDGIIEARRRVPHDGDIVVEAGISYRRGGWGAHQVRDDAWLDLGTHLIDIVRWTASTDIVEVIRADLTPARAEVDVTTGRGTARIRARTDGIHDERVTIRAADGSVLADHRVGGPIEAVRARILPRGGPSALVASLAAQLDAFASAITDGGHPALATAHDGFAAMCVLDAARLAADRGRPVAVSTVAGRT